MHRILVEEKRWISEQRFLHALNYCMLLPGPEAQQLATYIGWLLHGTVGGLVAGTLFVLPGFVCILALSALYAGFHGLPWVEALLYGLKPAVMAVVVEAVIRIGRRALRNGAMVAVAVAAFVAIFLLRVSFPIIVLAAGAVGFLGGRLRPDRFLVLEPHGSPSESSGAGDRTPGDLVGSPDPPSLARSLRVATVCLALWFVPLLGLAGWLGPSSIYVQEGVFFSKAAVVTFGGAYAVLAYIAQQAVEVFGWLLPGEMLDGLGMAETTPGPLIQVVQFVGYMGAYRDPGPFGPATAGLLGSVVTTWVTFVPCFLWIFLGAPYIERLRGRVALTAALSAITAAVVGVILNLAIWFSLHTLFARVGERAWLGIRLHVPDPRTLDPAAAVIAAAAFVAMLRFRVGLIPTLAGCVLLGAAWTLLLRP